MGEAFAQVALRVGGFLDSLQLGGGADFKADMISLDFCNGLLMVCFLP